MEQGAERHNQKLFPGWQQQQKELQQSLHTAADRCSGVIGTGGNQCRTDSRMAVYASGTAGIGGAWAG